MGKQLIKLPQWQLPDNIEHAKIRILYLGKNLHEHAYLVGKDLAWVQKQLGTTAFEDWIEGNIWFGIRTSYRFMAHTKKCIKMGYLTQYHPNIKQLTTDTVTVAGNYQTVIIDPPWPMSTEADPKP